MTMVMDPKQKSTNYRRWVGTFLSLLAPGAGQFMAGNKRAGFIWLFALYALDIPLVYVFASSNFASPALAIILVIATLILWIVMLIQAYKAVPRQGAAKLTLLIIVCLLLRTGSSLIRRQCASAFVVNGNSMLPTMQGAKDPVTGLERPEDRLIVNKIMYWFNTPQRGDIVAFYTDGLGEDLAGRIYMKRVVGLPGDLLEIKQGKLFINGAAALPPISKFRYVVKLRQAKYSLMSRTIHVYRPVAISCLGIILQPHGIAAYSAQSL